LHNLHQHNGINNNNVVGIDTECDDNIAKLNLNFTDDTTNKSMSLSHPSLSLTSARSARYQTAVDRSRSPLWTALTTAQIITVDVDFIDEKES
jgi:hypothetical protein